MALLLAGALLLGFAACNRGEGGDDETTTAPETTEITTTAPPTTTVAPGFWSIELRGVPNVSTFTSQHAQYLPKVQVEMSFTNIETGRADKHTYGGITLRSLLSYCGVPAVNNVTVTAMTGNSTTYSPAMAMAEDTILAWEVDGALIDDDNPLRMCPKSGTAELVVRQVSSINVVVGIPEPTTVTTYPTYSNYTTRSTQRTTWSTYPSSVSGITPPTTVAPTNPDGTPVTTTLPTTVTTTTATTTTTRTRTSYIYTQPPPRPSSTQSSSAATARPKPPNWPDDVEWMG